MHPRLIASTVVPPRCVVRRCAGVGWLVADPHEQVVTVLDPTLNAVTTLDLPTGAEARSGCGGDSGIFLGTGSHLLAYNYCGTVRWQHDFAVNSCHLDAVGRLWVFQPDAGRLAVFDAVTGRPLGAVGSLGEDCWAEFHPHPDGVHLGVAVGGPGHGWWSHWATMGPDGLMIRHIEQDQVREDRLLAVSGDGTRYVTRHGYRLIVADFPTGRFVASCDVSGDGPPHLVVEGAAVVISDSLLLVVGYRTFPGVDSGIEHVILSINTLTQRETVDYGFRADDLGVIGSYGDGTWLTVDRARTVTVWSIDWPLVPLRGQLPLF